MLHRLLYILAFSLVTHFTYGQQDPLLSSYQFNQLPFNPAYTGTADVTSFDLHYRSQWSGLEGAPQTVFFSGTTSIVENKVGIGFFLLQDKSGIINNTDVNVSFGYELDITNDVTLSFGLQTGVMSIKYDYSALNLEDPTDEDFVAASDGLNKLNFGSGLFISSKNFYVGFSIPKMLKVTEANGASLGERYNRHYYLSAGFILDPIQSVKLKPYVLVRLAEDSPASIELGVNALLVNTLWVGLFTRNLNSIGISTSIGLSNGLRAGYIGELALSDSSPSSGLSTHEITLGIDLALFEKQTVGKRYY